MNRIESCNFEAGAAPVGIKGGVCRDEYKGKPETAQEAQGLEVRATEANYLLNGDIEYYDLVRLSDATAVIDQLRERVAELEEDFIELGTLYAEIFNELAALKSAPVVMPERKGMNCTDWRQFTDQDIGFNKALDEVARLNRSKT